MVGTADSGHPHTKDTIASFHILSNSLLTKHAVPRRHTITDIEGVVQDILKWNEVKNLLVFGR